MKTIDCRNQPCPAPVISTKKALEQSTEVICVLVNDKASRDNVTRFATNRGYQVAETADGDTWTLTIQEANAKNEESSPLRTIQSTGDKILLITSDILGEGADDLGLLLIKNFIATLLETDTVPDKILLLNSGVLLAINGSESLDSLKELENKGVEIFACGVCLDYFQKKEQLAVGKVTNMLSTAEYLLSAGTVIKL